MDAPWCTGTSGSVMATTMKNEATEALDEKNFRPVMTQSSPSRTARVARTRADPHHPAARSSRSRRRNLPGQQSGQVPVLLLWVPKRARISVPVSEPAFENDRRPGAAARISLISVSFTTQTLAAELRAQMWCPQTLVAYLLLERIDDAAALVVQGQELTAGKQHFQRFHFVPNEFTYPLDFFSNSGSVEKSHAIDYSYLLRGMPPSARTTEPVVKLEASDARNSAAPTISEGFPARLSDRCPNMSGSRARRGSRPC